MPSFPGTGEVASRGPGSLPAGLKNKVRTALACSGSALGFRGPPGQGGLELGNLTLERRSRGGFSAEIELAAPPIEWFGLGARMSKQCRGQGWGWAAAAQCSSSARPRRRSRCRLGVPLPPPWGIGWHENVRSFRDRRGRVPALASFSRSWLTTCSVRKLSSRVVFTTPFRVSRSLCSSTSSSPQRLSDSRA